jgi:Ca-activated chloride channel family protein
VLLDGLANENRGAVAYIEPKEDIEVKVSNFFAKVNNPVLSDVKIDWGGVETDLVYPRATPDVFHGSQLVLMGRYRPRPSATRLTLTGKVNGRERRFMYDDLQFPEKQGDNEFLPHLWAMRRVGHLLDQIRVNGESKELRDEIVDLGTRYGIVTPYTSYLVLEPGTVSQNSRGSGGLPPAAPIPGRSGGVGGAVSNLPLNGRESVTETVTVVEAGKTAVDFSKKKEAMREADKLVIVTTTSDSENRIRQVAGKTFYLRGGVWTDSEFKADAKLPVVKLKFASDEYFNLTGQEAKLAECFALGQRVVVVWKGKVYQVEE